jgi:hypothetical protein
MGKTLHRRITSIDAEDSLKGCTGSKQTKAQTLSTVKTVLRIHALFQPRTPRVGNVRGKGRERNRGCKMFALGDCDEEPASHPPSEILVLAPLQKLVLDSEIFPLTRCALFALFRCGKDCEPQVGFSKMIVKRTLRVVCQHETDI